jgi:hypothetical protein
MNTKLNGIQQSSPVIATPNSVNLISKRIYIDGNPAFDSMATTEGWPGNGSAVDPYIIDGYGFNLHGTSGWGVYIQNTDRHFIMSNCIWYFPLAKHEYSGGMNFVNVENGQISHCTVYGTPTLVDDFPTFYGIRIEESSNIVIDDFEIINYVSGTLYHVYHGIYIINSQDIKILNSHLPASIPIMAQFSSNLTIEENLMQWSGGYPINSVKHNIGIYLLMTTNSRIADNRIGNFVSYGIWINGESNYNTIVENIIWTGYGGTQIQESNSIGTQYLDISTPDDQITYPGPNAPSPGYYPASSFSKAGIGFENEADDPFSISGWSVSAIGEYSATITPNKTDSDGIDHKKVAAFYTDSDSSLLELDHNTAESHQSGTTEGWFLIDDPILTGNLYFSLSSKHSSLDEHAFKILVEDGQFKYTAGAAILNTSVPVENDKWYRFSIDYSADGSYSSLNAYQYKFKIFDSSGMMLFSSQPMDYQYDVDIQYFHLHVQGGPSSEMTVFLDAIGHYWPDDPANHGYNVGDNSQEGMLMTYSIQRQGLSYQKLGYSVNLNPTKFITWNPSLPDYELTKFVIPTPTQDGAQNISFFWANSGGSPVNSITKHFSTYFKTYFSVSNYMENGINYPPGTMVLADSEDLNVSLTFSTANWYYQTTWTNASYYYRINEGIWNGPYTCGSGYGTQSAQFIIGEGNYSDFDNLYYYVTLDQYTNDSTYLETYYLAQSSEVLFHENEAREYAFRKKISPIPYELTLNYSTFYRSQIIANTSHISTDGQVFYDVFYPFVDILYQNISLNFFNTSASLDEYSISVFNETLLNHNLASDTSNISTSTSPIFTYSDEIASPFLLPENMNFTTGTPDSTHIKYLTIPAVSFSYALGYNLSFSGGLFNVTYVGIEQWPTSQHNVLKFVDVANNVTIRYDSTTRIMVFFEYFNNTVENRKQSTTLVLIDNNASYPINIQIDWYDEIISGDIEIIPDHLLAIVYDPPGDHSFGQISSGTTITRGFSVSLEKTKTYVDEWKTLYFGQGKETGISGVLGKIAGYLSKVPGLGDVLTTVLPGFGRPPGQHEFSQSITKGTQTDYEFSVTYGSTFTSSLNSEDPDLIGPGGGDLYYGTGMIIYWVVKHRVRYINTTEASNDSNTAVNLWNGTNWMEYGLVFNSSFAILGAHLDDYNLSSLTQYNPFLNPEFSDGDYSYLKKYQTGTLFWTPDYITELEYSTSESYTETHSFTVDVSKSDFYCWNQILTGSASVGLGFVAEVSLGAGLNVFESSGRRGWTYEFEMSTISTSATTQNRQTIAHFEDDDGTPIGQHDQFGVEIYQDLRYNTFGYHIISEFTYTSSPYENGTQDRRPPKTSELLELREFIGGEVLLQAIAMDDETGVKNVKIYVNEYPVFSEYNSELLVTLSPTDSVSDVFNYLWSTSPLQGTYYLFVTTEDNSGNVIVSTSIQVKIDNRLPETCFLSAYEPYEGPIALYTTAFDSDSGIDYVEYWDGDPTNQSSVFIGLSTDASSSYRYIWATDPNGTNDGVHFIYARAYDKAGNILDSNGIEIEVDTFKERRASFPGFLGLILVLVVLSVTYPKRKKR